MFKKILCIGAMVFAANVGAYERNLITCDQWLYGYADDYKFHVQFMDGLERWTKENPKANARKFSRLTSEPGKLDELIRRCMKNGSMPYILVHSKLASESIDKD